MALALVAAATIAVLADDEEQDSQAASWSAAWKNRYLSQLAKRAKRDYSSGSTAGRSVDGASLLLNRAGGQRRWGRTRGGEATSSWYATCSSLAVSKK